MSYNNFILTVFNNSTRIRRGGDRTEGPFMGKPRARCRIGSQISEAKETTEHMRGSPSGQQPNDWVGRNQWLTHPAGAPTLLQHESCEAHFYLENNV